MANSDNLWLPLFFLFQTKNVRIKFFFQFPNSSTDCHGSKQARRLAFPDATDPRQPIFQGANRRVDIFPGQYKFTLKMREFGCSNYNYFKENYNRNAELQSI